MDTFLSLLPTVALIALTLPCYAITYAVYRFNARISPKIPYAGEGSFLSRLRVPVEYGCDPVAFLCKTRKQLGDVFCVDMFVFRFIYMLGPEANKVLLRAAEDDCSFYKPSTWAFGPAFEKSMADPDFVAFMTKFRKSSFPKQELLDVNFSECKAVADSHFENWAKRGVVPLFHSISELIISVATVYMLGLDFHEKHGAEFVPQLMEFDRLVQKPLLRCVPSSLWWLTSPGRRILQICRRVDELAQLEVQALAADPKAAASRIDYFARIVTATGGPSDNRFPISHFGRHVQSMVFASLTNSANTIPWLFLHARRHPHALERIKEEIASMSAHSEKTPGRVPRPYLDACLRETGRLYTNMTMLRLTRKPVHLMGHAIPTNSFLAASPLATQRAGASPEYDAGPGTNLFENAGVWEPARFLADGGRQYSEWFRRNEFVQFGAHHHACPGEKLAKMFMFDLVLQTWFENYDIEVVSGLREGEWGIDGVGADAAWAEGSFGTPNIFGNDVMVSVVKRASKVDVRS